ncbi:MAG: BamA/TamA family outer membrane protein [Bacteroidia bacterium]
MRKSQDSLSASIILANYCEQQAKAGYADCHWEDLQLSQNSLSFKLEIGAVFIVENLHLQDLPDQYRQQASIDRLVRKAKPLQWPQISEALDLVIDLYQNEGYPFAAFHDLEIKYTPLSPDTMATDIRYQFDPGPLITVDSIFIKGNPREKEAFIHSLTRYFPGDAYNQKRIDEIPRILNNSIYYEKVGQPEISFTADESAYMTLNVQRKKAGKFDVLLGILPPVNDPDNRNQRVQVTGTIDILLVSPLRFGEIIQLKYDKLTSTSQQTDLKLVLPYLFRTPLRLEGSFNLLKQEEDFLNINAQAGGRYAFSPFLSAQFYYRTRDTRLILETLNDTSLQDLDQLDGNRQLVGVGFKYENLDYRFNPASGWDANLEIGLGRRQIRQNVNLSPELYEGININQITREVDLSLKWYYSVAPRHVIHLANQTYWLDMEQIFRNDQRQVGGARSIRGFNENAFFTDFYTFFTAEYRLQLERNSFLFGFADYAYVQDRALGELLHPFGVGLGMNYGTPAGIISISYAIGTSENVPFQPARGRIHIGLVNQF